MANFTRNAKRQKAEDTTFHDTEDLPEGGGGGGGSKVYGLTIFKSSTISSFEKGCPKEA